MDTQKRFLVKLYIGLIVLFLGILFCTVPVKAANPSAFDYMTEIHIEDSVWRWKDEELRIDVAKDEAVNVQCLLNFTREEWLTVYKDGKINLDWSLPKNVEVVAVSKGLASKIDDTWTAVGDVDIVDSKITIEIDESYQQQISNSSRSDFSVKLLLKFPKGEHQLTDKITVNASDIGGSKATWAYDSVLINVIDADEESKLLGNARVEIHEAQYTAKASYGTATVFQQFSQESLANRTFLYENNGIITIEDKKAEVKGGFEPGNLYYITEVVPPVGYLPVNPEVKIGFYHYDGLENTGTARKYAELNAPFTERYKNEGAVAILGAEAGYGELRDPNVYLKNKKIPAILVKKEDALTGKAMKDVKFTLQIPAAQADYSFSEYQKLGWTQDTATQTYQLTMTTDSDGKLTFAAGTVPYCSNMYELVETVPKGYAGYGGTLTTRFQMKTNEEGALVLLSESGEDILTDGMLVIENEPVAEVEILKVNEAGRKLEGAVFALYGEKEQTNADIIEKSGKKYYKLQEITTGKDGIALFRALAEGTYYLMEKEAPKGYIPLKDSHKIEITKDIIKDGKYTVTITNKQSGTPTINTGGRGIFRYIAIAVLLFVIGGALFLTANKKKIRKMILKARRRAQAERRRNGARRLQGRTASQKRRPPQRRPQKGRNPQRRKRPQGRNRR